MEVCLAWTHINAECRGTHPTLIGYAMNPDLILLIKENLWDILGFIGGVLAFIGLLIAGTFKVTKWHTSVNKDLKDLEPARTLWGGLSEKVNGMSDRINQIWGHLNNLSSVRSNSPISLTPLGEEISDKINAKQLAEKYFKNVVPDSNSRKLNAFQIQTISMDFAKSRLIPLLSREEKNLVEIEAFQRGMILHGVLEVIGVHLRDIWLKSEGIDISQIDNKDSP